MLLDAARIIRRYLNLSRYLRPTVPSTGIRSDRFKNSKYIFRASGSVLSDNKMSRFVINKLI